jgi:hypothetical protein
MFYPFTLSDTILGKCFRDFKEKVSIAWEKNQLPVDFTESR